MSNRFRDPSMRQMYDACTGSARKGCFGISEGLQRHGSSHAAHFWNGYNDLTTATSNPDDREFRTTLGYAAYRAGQDFKKEQAA